MLSLKEIDFIYKIYQSIWNKENEFFEYFSCALYFARLFRVCETHTVSSNGVHVQTAMCVSVTLVGGCEGVCYRTQCGRQTWRQAINWFGLFSTPLFLYPSSLLASLSHQFRLLPSLQTKKKKEERSRWSAFVFIECELNNGNSQFLCTTFTDWKKKLQPNQVQLLEKCWRSFASSLPILFSFIGADYLLWNHVKFDSRIHGCGVNSDVGNSLSYIIILFERIKSSQ